MKMHHSKMTTGLGIIIVLIISAVVMMGIYTTPSAAQTQPTDEMTSMLPRTITVVGEGTVKTEPDMAEATIGVQVSRSSVEAATQEAETIMDMVLVSLREQGIADADIQTSGFNVFVQQPFEAQGQSGDADSYQVSNNVRVTIHDLTQVSAVLGAAIEAGANNIYGVNFRISETDQLESEARQQAMTNAKAKAQELAELAEVELGQVISVSEVIGGPGRPFGTSLSTIDSIGGAGGAGPISPGAMEVRLQLEVVYTLN